MSLRVTLSIYLAALQIVGALGDGALAETAQKTGPIRDVAALDGARTGQWPDFIARPLDGA